MSIVINNFYIDGSTRFIRIKREGMALYVDGRTQGFRVRITATESLGMPLAIFVYQHLPFPDPDTGYQARFVNVASPNDLQEYQVGEVGDSVYPFYRLNQIDLVFRNVEMLEEAVEKLYEDIAQLVESLNFMDNLEPQEEVTFGTPPSSSSSSSSSSD